MKLRIYRFVYRDNGKREYFDIAARTRENAEFKFNNKILWELDDKEYTITDIF